MFNVFVLFPGNIPTLPDIQEKLKESCNFILLDKVESLFHHRNEKGIVLIGGESLRTSSILGMIRTIAPHMSNIVVVQNEHLHQIDRETVNFTDLLITPYQPIELVARIGSAINLSEVRYLLETSAQMDEVTELYNYGFFVNRLSQELARSVRYNAPLTCILMSIYYYEVYMDTYGYSFVHSIIQQVAKTVKEHIRQEDIAARLGDNEIAILLPMSTEKGAFTLTQRLIKHIEQIPLQAGDQTEHIHIKAGVAGFPNIDEKTTDPDTLIRYTRHALHHARCDEKKKIQLFSEMRPFVG